MHHFNEILEIRIFRVWHIKKKKASKQKLENTIKHKLKISCFRQTYAIAQALNNLVISKCRRSVFFHLLFQFHFLRVANWKVKPKFHMRTKVIAEKLHFVISQYTACSLLTGNFKCHLSDKRSRKHIVKVKTKPSGPWCKLLRQASGCHDSHRFDLHRHGHQLNVQPSGRALRAKRSNKKTKLNKKHFVDTGIFFLFWARNYHLLLTEIMMITY